MFYVNIFKAMAVLIKVLFVFIMRYICAKGTNDWNGFVPLVLCLSEVKTSFFLFVNVMVLYLKNCK